MAFLNLHALFIPLVGPNLEGISTKLTRKGEEFVWSEAYEKGFQELKKRLTFALVLVLPNAEKEFEV